MSAKAKPDAAPEAAAKPAPEGNKPEAQAPAEPAKPAPERHPPAHWRKHEGVSRALHAAVMAIGQWGAEARITRAKYRSALHRYQKGPA